MSFFLPWITKTKRDLCQLVNKWKAQQIGLQFFLAEFLISFIFSFFIKKKRKKKWMQKVHLEKTGLMIIIVHSWLLAFQKGYEPKSASTRKHTRYPVVFTRLVDGALQNLLDLIFQDFVGFWLNDLAFGSEQLINNMKQDVWGAIQSLHDRLSHVDHTKLVVCSIVNKLTFHFEKIRIAQAAS